MTVRLCLFLLHIIKAKELGITDIVLGIMDKIQDTSVATAHMNRLPKDISMRYAALFAEAGADATGKMLRELKLDNNTIDTATKLAGLHGLEFKDNEISLVFILISVRFSLIFFSSSNIFLNILVFLAWRLTSSMIVYG